MAVSLKHAFTSGIADGGDNTLVQPSNWNAEHTLTLATDKLLGRVSTGTGAAEEVTFTDFAQTLLDDADAATAQATLGLVPGTNVQAWDADLDTIAGLAKTDSNFIVGNGSAWVVESGATARTSMGAAASGANTDITSVYLDNTGLKIKDTDASHGLSLVPGSNLTADRTLTLTTGDAARTLDISAGSVTISTAGAALIDDASASAQRTTLGVGTGDSPQFTAIELGHATDTTLARSAAGVVTIEGVEVVTLSRTQTLTNKTLTSPTITTPGITDPTITGTILEDVYAISDGAAFEIDPGNGSIQTITLGANRTPKGTNFLNGESVTLWVLDGTAYTITWSDATFGGSGVVWAGGSAPTLDTTKYTVITLTKHNNQVYGFYAGAC